MLDGRVVIVTGGGRGLGRAHCLELARNGATVVVNDLGVGIRGEAEENAQSPAEEVVAEIVAMGGTAMADGTSVTDFAGMGALVQRVVETYGDLHAVVNNAGFLRDRMMVAMTEDEFDAVIEVHLKGTFALTKHACLYWRDQVKSGKKVSGRVVSTTSGAGLFGNVGQANYGSAKAGIATMMIIASLEMERYGVTANAISPIAATRMLATVGRTADESGGWDKLDPANCSPVVAWLCSEESGWMTGQVLRVDGNTVSRVETWTVQQSFRSKSGEAVTIEEVGLGLRKMLGTAARGLGG
ncbi:MAG: SDR family NAD(P)-dependent oxidoreductase [Actinomycetota bacterium]|nr:SDR family NAD(P)-dependent oxidoreductase [Actinomycetota bacterium]